MRPSSKDFLNKMGSMSTDFFCEKLTHLGSTSPYTLTSEYPPSFSGPYLDSLLHRPLLTKFFTPAEPSSVASLICQEGQSERNFPIFAFSSRFFWFFPDFFPGFSWFFPDFWQIFAVRGGTLPPLPPQWLCHWLNHLFPTTKQIIFPTTTTRVDFLGCRGSWIGVVVVLNGQLNNYFDSDLYWFQKGAMKVD